MLTLLLRNTWALEALAAAFYFEFCEAQGNRRAKGRSGSRLSIVDYRLSIVDIDFPEALH